MDVFASKLDVFVYKLWTYIILPVFILGSLYLAYNENFNAILWFSLACLLQIIGLYRKSKIAYWTNFLFILVAVLVISLTKDIFSKAVVNDVINGHIANLDGVIQSGAIGGLYGLLVIGLFCRWYKTKPIFYPVKLEDINWNESSLSKGNTPKNTERFLAIGVICALVLAIGYVLHKNHPKNEALPSYSNAKVNPLVTSNISNNKRTEQLDNNTVWYQEVSRQIPDLHRLLAEPDFISFLNAKGNEAFSLIIYAGEHKDASMIPKIKALIDEYNTRKQNTPDVRIAFYCALVDERKVFISQKSPDEYAYLILGREGNPELNFYDNIQRIKKNSVLYSDELIFVMQNGNYQYHISGKSSGTSVSVYNGKKILGVYYCKMNETFWDDKYLPVLDVKQRKINNVITKTQKDSTPRINQRAKVKESDPDRIAGFEAAKKFLIANKGKPLEQVYSLYNKKLNSYDEMLKFDFHYQQAFKEYANPYGEYAKEILK